MRLKRLWSCNQRVLSYSMPAERVWGLCRICFQPCRPQHRTPKPPALMRGKNVKAFWLPELFNQSSISVSEPEKWLESSGLPEILSDCDCGMKWALCGVAAAAKFEMCGQKAIWELLVVNLWLELAKQAAPRTFSNESGVMDWEFGLVSGGAMIKQAFDDLAANPAEELVLHGFYQPKPV